MEAEPNSSLLTWQELDCAELRPRGCHKSVVMDDLLITFGGWDGAAYFNDAIVLNLIDLKWQKATITGDEVTPRYTHSANLYQDDKIIIIGGYAGKQGVLRECSMMVLENKENLEFKWVKMATTEGNSLYRSDHSANIQEDNLYLFGGADRNEESTNELWWLNIEKLEWKKLETSGQKPRERYGHCSAIYNDNLYVFGGHTSDLNTELNDLWAINLNTLKWQKIEHKKLVPTQRTAASMEEVDGQLIIFGGQFYNSFFNDLYSFDIKTQEWQKLDPKGSTPRARSFHSSVYYKNKYIILGGEVEKSECIFDVYAIELEDINLIPKQISYKAITKNAALSTLNNISRENLFADIVFEIEDKEFPAHRAVLAGSCKYFYNMFKNAGETNRIKISDAKASTFKALLNFLYCGDGSLEYTLAIDLLGLAKKYSISKLQRACEMFLAKTLTKANVKELTNVAECFEAELLKKAISEFSREAL